MQLIQLITIYRYSNEICHCFLFLNIKCFTIIIYFCLYQNRASMINYTYCQHFYWFKLLWIFKWCFFLQIQWVICLYVLTIQIIIFSCIVFFLNIFQPLHLHLLTNFRQNISLMQNSCTKLKMLSQILFQLLSNKFLTNIFGLNLINFKHIKQIFQIIFRQI